MHSTLKKLFLGFFAVAAGTLFWLFIKHTFFQNPEAITEHFWSLKTINIFSALFLLYGTIIAVVAFVVPSRAWAQGMLLAAILPFAVVMEEVSFHAVGAFVFLWVAVFTMREFVARESASRITLSIEKATARNLSLVLSAIAVAVSVAFFESPAVTQLKDIRIPQEVFRKIVAPLELAVRKQVALQAQSFIGRPENAIPEGAPQNILNLDPEQRKALEQLARPLIESASSEEVSTDIADTLYATVNGHIARIASLSPTARRILALSLAISLLVTIRIIAVPIGWLVIVLAMIIFNVFTYTGFVKIGTVQVDKETIEL